MQPQITNQLSDRLKVTPLKEGEVAIYQLCLSEETDHTRIDEATGKKKKNQPSRSMLGKAWVFDPVAGQRVLLRNITGYTYEEMPDRSQKAVPTVERVLFPRTSTLMVTAEFPGTYEFMERHPQNRDNPYRDKGKMPIFFRVDQKKRAIEENEKNFILVDALNHLKEADRTEVMTIVKGLDDNAKKEINLTQYELTFRDLFKYAQKYPVEVMKASTNKEVKMKLQILDAEYFNILQFIDNVAENGRKWYFVDDKKPFLTLELHENKIEGLMKHFLSGEDQGAKDYTKMFNLLKKMLKPSLQEA